MISHAFSTDVPIETSSKHGVKGASVLQRSAQWLSEVDEIDFDQLQHVLYLAYWLGAEDEDVAISCLAAIERFTLYRRREQPLEDLRKSFVRDIFYRAIAYYLILHHTFFYCVIYVKYSIILYFVVIVEAERSENGATLLQSDVLEATPEAA